MRTLLIAACLALACAPALAGPRLYGAGMPTGEAVPLGIALTAPASAGEPAKYSGRITEVCQNKGCWLVLADGDRMARVMMKDHAFSVPADASGPAVVYGTMQEIDVGEGARAHLADDGAAEVAPREVRIEAQSVLIGAGAQ